MRKLITINQPLNQLLGTCIRPPLFLNGAKYAGGGIFFKNIVIRILQTYIANEIIPFQQHAYKERAKQTAEHF